MNKKIILLMLALPLILMLSLFTTSGAMSVMTSISVSSIVIDKTDMGPDKNVSLDLDKGEVYTVSYTVYPIGAANKKVVFSTQAIGNATLATFDFDEETKTLRPRSCGIAKVIFTTEDGGCSDGFIVTVESNELGTIQSTLDKSVIEVGQTAQIQTVFNPKYYPFQQVEYTVLEGKDVVKVDSRGRVQGIGAGTATIRVNSFVNKDVYSNVTITVERAAPVTIVDEESVVYESTGALTLDVDESAGLRDADVTLTVSDPSAVTYTLDLAEKELRFAFLRDGYSQVTFTLSVTYMGKTYTDTCMVTCRDTLDVVLGDGWDLADGQGLYLNIEHFLYFDPINADVTYTVTVSGASADAVKLDTTELSSGKIKITYTNPDKIGTSRIITLTLTVTPAQGDPVEVTQTFWLRG